MHLFTLVSTLAATTLALPAPIPAGGPMGPISYPLGTVITIAVLQPSGNDFMASNYTTDLSNAATYIETDSSDTTPPLNFVTVNETDAAGYTGLAMQDPGYGLALTDSGMLVEKDACMEDFYVVDGTLRNSQAPEGFYYCNANSPSLGRPNVGRVSYEIGGAVPEGCHAAAFVTFF